MEAEPCLSGAQEILDGADRRDLGEFRRLDASDDVPDRSSSGATGRAGDDHGIQLQRVTGQFEIDIADGTGGDRYPLARSGESETLGLNVMQPGWHIGDAERAVWLREESERQRRNEDLGARDRGSPRVQYSPGDGTGRLAGQIHGGDQ